MKVSLHALHSASRARVFNGTIRYNLSCSLVNRRSLVSAADLQFGQPLHETHPHLLKRGEVTPGITAQEYADRRSNLAKALPKNSIAVLAASELKYRSGAVFYEFHQDPDFFYLTGFNEPEALAIIEKTGSDSEYSFHLYVRPKDPKAELWDGARSGVQAAQDVFNADEVGDINVSDKIIPEIVNSSKTVYTDLPNTLRSNSFFAEYFSGASKFGREGFGSVLANATSTTVKPLRPLMNDLRIIKSAAEIANMRKAGQASGRSISEAMRSVFATERELAAFLAYKFTMHGCDGQAYVPVVAGGKNSLSIHYVRNDDVLTEGELVLVDAGGEYGGYITDITRTWPVNGKFSPAQHDLYQVILDVQRTCVALCRESAHMSLDGLHKVAEKGLRDALSGLGFDMSGNALETLFPHHLGHYIGLDVHDAPGYSRRGNLKDGMCITIEPGIYVPDSDRWPEAFRGIGIRIEDSVCVQAEHPLVLTTEAVKEVVDIEAQHSLFGQGH
ncbi:xaa-pro dipeptidase app [Patellaria atrata CBS 101060]|uniref:Xaa-Pro aminopeptidase n=1 Tax=Patellaria atrata CBS 101060 TaxID=1346257 RepID=A0A9P4S7R7_9PEZI|nr:xaa-pro dipeptidase app [Patellaria atrata CBS 101060]